VGPIAVSSLLSFPSSSFSFPFFSRACRGDGIGKGEDEVIVIWTQLPFSSPFSFLLPPFLGARGSDFCRQKGNRGWGETPLIPESPPFLFFLSLPPMPRALLTP